MVNTVKLAQEFDVLLHLKMKYHFLEVFEQQTRWPKEAVAPICITRVLAYPLAVSILKRIHRAINASLSQVLLLLEMSLVQNVATVIVLLLDQNV